jgi:hypothetical protein
MKNLKNLVTKNPQPAKYIVDQKTGFRFEIIDEKADHRIFKVAENNIRNMANANDKSQKKNILFAAIIFIAIISMILVVISLNKPKVTHVKTPNVVYLLLKDAEKKLNKSGFNVVVVKVEDSLQAEDLVIEQSLQPNEEVDKGRTITITVIEKIKSGDYSRLVAVLPAFVNDDLYDTEEQTEYRFKVKKTVVFLEDMSSNDWALIGEDTEYSPWSEWRMTPIIETPTIQMETLLINDVIEAFVYYRWEYLNKEYKKMYAWTPYSGKDVIEGSLELVWKTLKNTPLEIINEFCSNATDTIPCANSKKITLCSEQWVLESTVFINDPLKTHVEYRSRTITPIYLYERRTSWSAWQETFVEKNRELDVQTRTVYRYRAK